MCPTEVVALNPGDRRGDAPKATSIGRASGSAACFARTAAPMPQAVRRDVEPGQAGGRVVGLAARRHPATGHGADRSRLTGRRRNEGPGQRARRARRERADRKRGVGARKAARPRRALVPPAQRPARHGVPHPRRRHARGAARARHDAGPRAAASRRSTCRRCSPTRIAGTRWSRAPATRRWPTRCASSRSRCPGSSSAGFAKAFGPIVGQRLADTGRALLGFPEYAGGRVAENVFSYARDEAGVLARGRRGAGVRRRQAAVAARVDALIERVDRIDASSPSAARLTLRPRSSRSRSAPK